MNEPPHAEQNNPPVRPFWRYCAGYGLLTSGIFLNFLFLLQAEKPFYVTTGVGLILIWVGILALQGSKTYFSVISSLILLFSVVGFSDNLITHVGQESNRDPKFVVHGLFSLAWMLAFAMQADLVRTGRRGLHKEVGIFGFLAAVGLTISTVYVFYAVWLPWGEMLDRVQINRILLPSFVVFLVLAWYYRDRAQRHKRLLLVGTLYLLGPILARVVGGLLPAQLILWNGLFISLLVYDWVALRKVHPITYLGTAWFYLAWGVVKLT